MSSNKIADKIRKLMNQAKDTEGSPESEVFQAKALDLLARYGLTETDVADADKDMSEHVIVTFDTPKFYRIQHQALLAHVGKALGVYVVRYTGIETNILSGTVRNIERLKILFETLSLHVTAGASKVKGMGGVSTQSMRKSYWHGYSMRIAERIQEMENRVHEELRETGAALVPVNEYEKAMKAMKTQYKVQTSSSRQRIYNEGYSAGEERANSADIGQSKVQNRLELV